MGDKIGKVTEVVGRVTGDREVEAKGRVEQDAADPEGSVEEVSEGEIETERQMVRGDHGDIDPKPLSASERLVENELTGSPSGENSSPDGEQTQGGRTGAAEAFRTAWGAFAGTLTVSPARATTFALRGSTRF